jgi:hypothetical protein
MKLVSREYSLLGCKLLADNVQHTKVGHLYARLAQE